MISRRHATALIGCGAVSAWATAGRGKVRHAGGRLYDWKEAGRPGLWYAEGDGGTMVLSGPRAGGEPRGSMLVDTQSVVYGPQVRREVEEIAGGLALVVNTHHHADVTGGNRAMVKDVRVVAHPACRTRIEGQLNRYISQVKEFLHRADDQAKAEVMEKVKRDWVELHKQYAKFKPAEFAPTEVLAEDRRETTIGGRDVVLLQVRGELGAHTDNDVVVHLPSEDVLVVGGLVTANGHAVIDRDSGASTRGWIVALERLIGIAGEKTLVVPGEGRPGGVELLRGQLEYLQALRRAVEEAIGAGMTRAKVRELRPRLPVPAEAPHPRLQAGLGEVYDELKAERQAARIQEKRP